MEERTVTEQRRVAVKNLLECGYTFQQVADEMGFKSKNSVSYYAKGEKYHVHRLLWTGLVPYYECRCGTKFKEIKSL